MRGHERNGENVTKIADITNECKHEYGKQQEHKKGRILNKMRNKKKKNKEKVENVQQREIENQ